MKRTQEPPVPPVSGRLTNPLVFTAFLLLAVSVKCADYQATVLSDGPRAYYRFNDATGRSAINRNGGSLGAAGNATNDLSTGVVHPFPGALAGDGNRSEFFDSSARTIIPYSPALNPTNTHPFTVEAWFYPASDQINGGQCPINNRYAYSGVNRQGWVFFQRAPNLDYFGKGGYEGVGWNCRMYNENGGTGALDVTSQLPYQIGRWTHVVVVYDPVNVTNATLTMYIDGVAADRKSTRLNSSHRPISYAVFCLKKKKRRPFRSATSALFERTGRRSTSVRCSRSTPSRSAKAAFPRCFAATTCRPPTGPTTRHAA